MTAGPARPGRVMTGALQRALEALSPVERRALIRLPEMGMAISPPLRSVLLGVRAELLADMAAEADLLAAHERELQADRDAAAALDPPYPVATGGAYTMDAETGVIRPARAGEPGYVEPGEGG